jgi:hypothetical protein
MSRLLTSDSSVLADYARKNGVSSKNFAYGLVSKYMGGDENMSNINKIMGGQNSLINQIDITGGAMAKDRGLTFGADKYSMQADSTGMSIGIDQINSSLKTLGLDYEDVSKLMDSKGGGQKLKNFGGLVDKLVQGGSLSKEDWDSIDDPMLKQRLDSLAKMDPDELKSKVTTDAFLGYGNKQGDLDSKLQTLMETAGKGSAIDRVTRGVKDIWGFNLDSTEITDAIKNGKFGDLIEGARGGSQEGKDLQGKLRGIDNGDINDLREQYRGLLGDKNVSDADSGYLLKQDSRISYDQGCFPWQVGL